MNRKSVPWGNFSDKTCTIHGCERKCVPGNRYCYACGRIEWEKARKTFTHVGRLPWESPIAVDLAAEAEFGFNRI